MTAPSGAYSQHDPVEAFGYVVSKLREDIDGADESSCFFAEDPDLFPKGTPADVVYTVSPSPTGSFLEDEFVGGGKFNLSTSTYVVVTAHVQQDLEQANRVDVSVLDDHRSLFRYAKWILKALTGYHPKRPGTEDRVFNEPLLPSNYTRRIDQRKGSVQIAFRMDFDWYLDT